MELDWDFILGLGVFERLLKLGIFPKQKNTHLLNLYTRTRLNNQIEKSSGIAKKFQTRNT